MVSRGTGALQRPNPGVWVATPGDYATLSKVHHTPDGTVMFEIDGIDPSEMFLLIYVRPPHPSRASIRDFPLIRLRLEGPLVDEATTKWIVSQQNCVDPGEDSASLMYGKGAFRTLIGYLERELPSRGFRGIFLEYVRNTKLRSAAERYGFTPTGLPVDLDFLKLLGP